VSVLGRAAAHVCVQLKSNLPSTGSLANKAKAVKTTATSEQKGRKNSQN